MTKLTEKQAAVFRFVQKYIDTNGMPPTVDEISKWFKLNRNAIQGRIKGLIKKGALTDPEGKSRALRPVKGFRVRVKEGVK